MISSLYCISCNPQLLVWCTIVEGRINMGPHTAPFLLCSAARNLFTKLSQLPVNRFSVIQSNIIISCTHGNSLLWGKIFDSPKCESLGQFLIYGEFLFFILLEIIMLIQIFIWLQDTWQNWVMNIIPYSIVNLNYAISEVNNRAEICTKSSPRSYRAPRFCEAGRASAHKTSLWSRRVLKMTFVVAGISFSKFQPMNLIISVSQS